jgi:LPS-assembly protein
MYKFPKKNLSLAVLCALPLVAAAQEGLKLQSQPALTLTPPEQQEDTPLYIEADKLSGRTEREIEAEGDARLRKRGQAFFADWMRYDQVADEVTAVGKVRVEQGADVIQGDRLRYQLGTETGSMEKPDYLLRPPRPPRAAETSTPAGMLAPPTQGPSFGQLDARGQAERIRFEGPGQYHVEQGEYTTCGPGNDDWFIRARELDIDRNRDVGTARGASIVFKGQTIFYSPYLSFSLHQERKSGFLAPHYGSSNTSGMEFMLPYYWNIAPNRDATFYPRYMTKRGLQLGAEFRYLEPSYNGQWRGEVLPTDQQFGGDRYGFFVKHQQTFTNGWFGSVNVNKVSDDTYFRDLSTLIALTSQTLLPREGTLARGGTWGGNGTYSFSALAQGWQTLQTDPLAPLTPPYNRLPQLTLNAYKQDVLHSDFDLLSSFVAFEHPTLVNGKRMLAYPSLSLPLQSSYAYLTPKVGMHVTRYMIDPNSNNLQDQTRALPIFSTESGLVFERNTRIGNMPFINTLEPKLYYVYIPYRDQSRLPNFESGLQDVNFATIFSENQFSGQDRINDANQVTVGVTSRFIHEDTGIERLRVGLAQRYYLESQRVTLPGVAPRSNQTTSSDLLAVVSGTVAPHWTTDAGWQFNTDTNQSRKLNIGTRYQPEPGKVLNLAYRYTAELIKQTDISGQWPVFGRWTAVARWNYSLLDQRMLEGLAGFEYDGGCWVFRVVAHRFALATQAASTSIFVQLELNGVSRIGSNPLEILRRNIGGYSRFDPRSPRPQEVYMQ